MSKIKIENQKVLSNMDLLKLESKVAQGKIDAIKKMIAIESETTRVQVVLQQD